MDSGDIIELSLVFSLVVLPALGITARLALKPIVDAILRLKEGMDSRPAAEVQHLVEEVRQLRATVERLEVADSFHRSLLESTSRAPRE